ncbi:hypothetical protein [Clostridium sp. Cult3]|uniref:hypothetical protein n=1 Tax=Clostridium sp. Cult3 TaxID=2079004 RepID=UPI001F2166BD|nr:hypothetical protein [Clostridium sp. Cult3]MCF6461597.1 hypothetical protein [Clostridium sp. Cult3]
MKKQIVFLLIMVLVMNLTLVGCGSKKEEVEEAGKDETVLETDEEESTEGITVDKSLLSVDITLPSALIDDVSDFNEEEYIAENEGIKAAKINEDGSVTLTMTKKKHEEIVSEMKEEVTTSLSELTESEDTPYIKEVEYSKDFKEVKLSVDREAYEDAFDLTPLFVGILVGTYQVYAGEEFYTEVIIEDVATGVEINSIVYPDALED